MCYKLFVTLCVLPFFISCVNDTSIISTNIPESIYAIQAYNKTQKPSKEVEVQLNDNIDVNVIITDKFIPVTDNNRSEENTETLILPRKTIVAFSLPLIVIKKATREKHGVNFPLSGRLSQDELEKLIKELEPLNQDSSTRLWGFPALPHSSFRDFFPSSEVYTNWMSSIFIDYEKEKSEFFQQYNVTLSLANLGFDSIILHYLPSHIFFSQPQSLRNTFEIALLTNTVGDVPAVDLVYIYTKDSTTISYKNNSFIQWLFEENNQRLILQFTRDSQRSQQPLTLFFGRTYSNVKKTNVSLIEPYNQWLWEHGPMYSEIVYNY